MKVLHYVDENNLTWARPWLQLIKYLENQGIENHILCRPDGKLTKDLLENGISFSTYKPLIATLPQLCLGVLSIIKQIKPDILHTRLSAAAMIGGHWGNRLGIPVVSTIDKYPKQKYYRQSTKLIPCSTAIADHMVNQGLSTADMRVIFNPVNIHEYRKDVQARSNLRNKYDIGESYFIILGAGRFVDWKGFDTLLEACSLLADRPLAGRSWQLWLAGDGPEKQNLEKLAKSKSNLMPKVKFWGFVKDIRPLMWASDLFVLPSRNEPFGLVLLEAMASGLPVVATSLGGPLDIISDDSGWFFKPGDAQGLKNILKTSLQSKNLSLFSEKAQKRAQKFSVEKIGMQTIEFYKSIMKQ